MNMPNSVNGIFSVNNDLTVNGALNAEGISIAGLTPNATVGQFNITGNNANYTTPITLKNTSSVNSNWSVNLFGSNNFGNGLVIRNNVTTAGSLCILDGNRVIVNSTTSSSNINFQVTGSMSQLDFSNPRFVQGTSNSSANYLTFNDVNGCDFFSAEGDVGGGFFIYLPMKLNNTIMINPAQLSGGKVGINNNSPTANIHLGGQQLTPRIILGGTEFYTGVNSSTAGIAFLTGVNRPNNRQLWIGDSELLTQNSTNSLIRMSPSSGTIDSIKTDGNTGNDLYLGLGGFLVAATSGNVGIGISNPSAKLHISSSATIGQLRLSNDVMNRKIVLWDNGNNNQHEYYGLGVNSGEFRLQVSNNTDKFKFYSSLNATSSSLVHTLGGFGDAYHKRDLQANCFFSNVYSQNFGSNVTQGSVTATNLGLTNDSGIFMYSFARSDKNMGWSLVGILTWNGSSFVGNATLQSASMAFISISGATFNFNPATALFSDSYQMFLTRIGGSPVYTV